MLRQPSDDSKRRICYLRTRGYSFPEIHNKLGISYRKIYLIGKNVKIDTEYLRSWKSKWGGSHQRMLARQRQISLELKRKFSKAKVRDIIFALVALYWAEGEKIDFGFDNTDPWMIRLMVLGLQRFFNIPKNRIKLSIRIYEGMSQEECINFWLKTADLQKTNLIAIHVLEGKKHGKLRYGMCRIRVSKPADLLKTFRILRDFLIAPVAQLERASRS